MEYTIDRKAYRRNSCNDCYERVEKIETKRRSNSLFYSKIINSMLLLLFVLLLKFFYFEDEFNLLEEKFNSGYSYEFLKERINQKVNEIAGSNEINLFSGDENKEANSQITIEDISSTSGGGEYIEGIDGVNQLMADSKIIKENYEIKSPLNGTITSKFGCRTSDNPIVSSYHKGLDIASNAGTNIVAAHSGTVIQAGENGSYGNSVTIENGELVTLYAHCSSISKKEGDAVNIGETIGKVGMTGNATGPHLHFEIIYQGRFVNPEDIIKIGG